VSTEPAAGKNVDMSLIVAGGVSFSLTSSVASSYFCCVSRIHAGHEKGNIQKRSVSLEKLSISGECY